MPLGIQNHKQNIPTPPLAQRPIDISRVQNTINSFLPISNEYVDPQGNRVRLWEGKNTHFYGTVLGRQGEIKVIPSHKIINPLCKDSSAQADDGETPLYIAAQNNQLVIVQALIKEKVNLNLTTKHGMNSLICALHHGYEQIALELLLTQSTDVEYRLLNGKTALHFAIETKMENALKELIKQGANVNRILRNGYRPIHLAVIYDWLNGVKILSTSENIKLEAPLTSGKTARDLAIENNRREIVEFFDPSRSRAISWWTPWKLFYAKL